MTKEEFINILADTDLSNKEELEALYDSLKGEFIDKAVDYFCKNWLPTKPVMLFDKLGRETIGEQMKESIRRFITMTISDFFLKQTKKQIRECCKAVGLDKYRNMPSTIEEWCETFNLEQDDVIDYFHVIHRTRGSAAEVYVRFVLPNPVYPDCPIIFDSEFDFKTAKNGCTVSFTRILSYHQDTSVYKNHFEIFDDRPKYNEVSYDVFFSFLSDVSKPYQYDEYSKLRYVLKDEAITVWDVYQSVCKFTKAISLLLNSVIENFKDGSFIKKWNELEPDRKWNTGHEPLMKMYWGFILTAWYRVMIAGVKPAFSDYAKIFAAVTLHNKEFGDMVSKDLWVLTKFDNSDEEVKETFNKLISIYK